MRILPNTSWSSLLGENLGKAVGGGLAGGLEALTEHKMGQISQQKKVQGLASIGYSPEQANQLAGLPDQLLQQKLQNDNALRLMQQKESFTQARENEYLNRFGGKRVHNNQHEMQQNLAQAPDKDMAKYKEQLQGYDLGKQIFGDNAPKNSLGAPPPPPRKANGPPLQEGTTAQKGFLTPQELGIPTPTNRKEFADYTKLAIKQKNEDRKEDTARKMLEYKEASKFKALANKETLPYFNEVSKEEKSAKKIDLLTNRMSHLIEKGKLPDSVWYKQLKDLEELASPLKSIGAGAATGGAALAALGPLGTAAGGAVGAAIGGILGLASSMQIAKQRGQLLKDFPDTEEFEKLSSEFISGAKAIFGSRVTDNDLKAFMQTVPQLVNTAHGKKSIIRNIQTLNDATHARYEAMKEVIKENGGNRPADLSVQVEERANRKLDELANKFIKGI